MRRGSVERKEDWHTYPDLTNAVVKQDFPYSPPDYSQSFSDHNMVINGEIASFNMLTKMFSSSDFTNNGFDDRESDKDYTARVESIALGLYRAVQEHPQLAVICLQEIPSASYLLPFINDIEKKMAGRFEIRMGTGNKMMLISKEKYPVVAEINPAVINRLLPAENKVSQKDKVQALQLRSASGDKEIVVANIHLSYDPSGQKTQIKAITTLADQGFIIAGDSNSQFNEDGAPSGRETLSRELIKSSNLLSRNNTSRSVSTDIKTRAQREQDIDIVFIPRAPLNFSLLPLPPVQLSMYPSSPLRGVPAAPVSYSHAATPRGPSLDEKLPSPMEVQKRSKDLWRLLFKSYAEANEFGVLLAQHNIMVNKAPVQTSNNQVTRLAPNEAKEKIPHLIRLTSTELFALQKAAPSYYNGLMAAGSGVISSAGPPRPVPVSSAAPEFDPHSADPVLPRSWAADGGSRTSVSPATEPGPETKETRAPITTPPSIHAPEGLVGPRGAAAGEQPPPKRDLGKYPMMAERETKEGSVLPMGSPLGFFGRVAKVFGLTSPAEQTAPPPPRASNSDFLKLIKVAEALNKNIESKLTDLGINPQTDTAFQPFICKLTSTFIIGEAVRVHSVDYVAYYSKEAFSKESKAFQDVLTYKSFQGVYTTDGTQQYRIDLTKAIESVLKSHRMENIPQVITEIMLGEGHVLTLKR